MSAFTNRTPGYKAGVYLLFLALVLFLVGYGSPYWFTVESHGTGKGSTGLWMVCVESIHITECISLTSTSGTTVWDKVFITIRALTSICGILLIATCVYALATNCFRSFPGPRTRILEISAIVAGACGFVGSTVYAGYLTEGLDSWSNAHVDHYGLSWSFYLAAVGSALSVVAAVVIAIFNKPIDTPAAIGGASITMSNLQFAQSQPYIQGQPQSYIQGQPQPYIQGQPQPYIQGQPQPYIQGQPQPYIQGQPQPYMIQGQSQQSASYPEPK